LKTKPPSIATAASEKEEYNLRDIILSALHSKKEALLKNNVHYKFADKYDRYNKYINVTVAILSTIVGTSIFTALSKFNQNDKSFNTLRIITGLLSLSAAVFSALPSILKFSEKSAKHKKTANDFEIISQKLTEFLLIYNPYKNKTTEKIRIKAINDLTQITGFINNASLQALPIPLKELKDEKNRLNIPGIGAIAAAAPGH